MNLQKPGIEWTHVFGPNTGHTWNPTKGCQHKCAWRMPDGSTAQCYARPMVVDFEEHHWRPEILEEPLKLSTPAGIFIGSVADLMGAWVPDDQVKAVLDVCRRASWHIFFLLTKNPGRLLNFEYPPNVWIGASLPPSMMNGHALRRDQQETMLRSTLGWLRMLDGHTRWLSLEPLSWDCSKILETADVEWAVIGAATNGKTVYQPAADWVKRAVVALRKRKVKVFFKGNLKDNPAASPWLEEYPAVSKKVEPVQQTLF